MVVKVGCLGSGPAFATDGVVEAKGVICWISRDPPPGDTGGAGRNPLPLHCGQSLTPSEREEKRTLYSIPLPPVVNLMTWKKIQRQ